MLKSTLKTAVWGFGWLVDLFPLGNFPNYST